MSITTKDEYFGNLDILRNVNQPSYALLPAAEKIYDIDVNDRTISNQRVTIVEKDHKSKTLYFSIDRFVDYMDLSQTQCVIQYNVEGKSRFYPVPYYDIYTKISEGKMIFPWNLSYALTKNTGTIPFSVRFFRIGTFITENNDAELIFTYNFNTLPSYVHVEKALTELQIDENDEVYLQPGDREIIMEYVDRKMQTLSRKVYWTVLEDDFTDTTIDVSTEIQEDILDIFDQIEADKKEENTPSDENIPSDEGIVPEVE